MAIEKEDTVNDDFKEKLQMYQNLKEQYLEQRQELKAEDLEQKSLTDTDSRRMKNNGSLDICYNVQSVVNSQNHFVIDISTTNDINDQNQLYVMAKDAAELLDVKTPTIIADTGYYNGAKIKSGIDDGMSVLIKKAKANNSTKDNEFRKEKFSYDKDMMCMSVLLVMNYFFENTSKNGMKYRKYKCLNCNSCKYKKACTSSVNGRTIQQWEHENILESIYQDTLDNNDIYRQRRCIVEHPFGTVKRFLGYSFFFRRQMDNVDAEASSMFFAYNFKR